HLYPLNNIKRHESKALIKLRYDVASLQSRRPVLLVDRDIPNTNKLYPILVIGASLIFVFTDIVYIFIDDAAYLKKVV
ncbi:hypothetical protein N7475_000014, partial [Penicillium sp. IBT 31633x]